VIVVCGEALIDLVPAADGSRRARPGGGPFNTARALARLGVSTAFLGRLSRDGYGRRLADLLTADGADLSLVSFGSEPTTLAVAEVDAAGLASYRFVIDGTAAPNLTPAMLPERLEPGVEALHVGTLGLSLEPMASTIADFIARESDDRLVMLDPNIRTALLTDPDRYRTRLDAVMARTTVVKASDDDLAWMFPGLDLEAAAARILASGPTLAVVTLGADGAVGISSDMVERVPAPRVQVIDTIGAGDAFGAALLAWLDDRRLLRKELRLNAAELRSALEFACLAASITCTRAGAEPPRRAELQLLRGGTVRQAGKLPHQVAGDEAGIGKRDEHADPHDGDADQAERR
jgi:fructokinase